jgi:hypothetical protein
LNLPLNLFQKERQKSDDRIPANWRIFIFGAKFALKMAAAAEGCTLIVFLLVHALDQLTDGLTALLYFSQVK